MRKSEYKYLGDRHTAPELKGKECVAVRNAAGKCIRGRNGSMLVEFESGKSVVIARLLRKLDKTMVKKKEEVPAHIQKLRDENPKLFVNDKGEISIGILSLWQPWASSIVIEHPKYPGTGIKQWETRGWPIPPHYIGKRVLVHAALKNDKENAPFFNRMPFYDYSYLLTKETPYGALIGSVELVKSITTEKYLETHNTGRFWEELPMGNYSEGRFAWKLEKPHLLPSTVPCRGNQKLWTVKLQDLPAATHSFILKITK